MGEVRKRVNVVFFVCSQTPYSNPVPHFPNDAISSAFTKELHILAVEASSGLDT